MAEELLFPAALALSFVALGGWGVVRLGKGTPVEWGSLWLNALDGFNRLFCRHWHRLDVPPLPLPASGPAIIVANHTAGLDPLLLMAVASRRLSFLIATEQYERRGLRGFFRRIGLIPVDRAGRPERALRHALERLDAGEVIAIFPQGVIRLPGEPPKPLKGGAFWLAEQSGAPIVVVRIEGVARMGRVLGSILPRSRARMTVFGPFTCTGDNRESLTRQVQALIEGNSSS